MAIRVLSAQELARIHSARSTLAPLADKALEWFADDTGAVLGAISYHQFELNWSFIVLSRYTDGRFRTYDRVGGFRDHDDARQFLLEKMAIAAASPTESAPPPSRME